MKALEKDRRRRYETANDFAADVMSYLTDRPVEACPPSASYRLAKFARRNRGMLSTAGDRLHSPGAGDGRERLASDRGDVGQAGRSGPAPEGGSGRAAGPGQPQEGARGRGPDARARVRSARECTTHGAGATRAAGRLAEVLRGVPPGAEHRPGGALRDGAGPHAVRQDAADARRESPRRAGLPGGAADLPAARRRIAQQPRLPLQPRPELQRARQVDVCTTTASTKPSRPIKQP